MTADVNAFILVGGRSSRFGSDKAVTMLDGEPLAGRIARIVEEAIKPARLTLVTSSENAPPLAALLRPGRPFITDLKPGFGAWSGLDAALAYTLSDWAFVIACDLPFITSEFITLLRDMAASDIEAVVPTQADGRIQPLCAFYKAVETRALLDKVFSGRNTMPPLATLAERLNSRVVEPDEYSHLAAAERLLNNVNTPADLGS